MNTYTNEERAYMCRLHAQGLTWKEIGKRYGISDESARCAALRRGAAGKMNRVMEQILISQIPKDTRGLTARLMGDPLPGRSALDRRQNVGV